MECQAVFVLVNDVGRNVSVNNLFEYRAFVTHALAPNCLVRNCFVLDQADNA